MKFEKLGQSGRARRGRLTLEHGVVETPVFMPVGTYGTVKGMLPRDIEDIKAQIILGNTFHLYLRPGLEVIKEHGGLHKFMKWDKPILTDSGGFQVMSLGVGFKKVLAMDATGVTNDEVIAAGKERLAVVDEDGVTFKSHLNGDRHRFTPEVSMRVQHELGADIMFAFDELTTLMNTRGYQEESVARTHRWAARCLAEHARLTAARAHKPYQALFGVVQGAQYEDLRRQAARGLAELEVEGQRFDGFGLGGALEKENLGTIVGWCADELPEDKPRHLLGISEPDDFFAAIENGADTFDCVNPSRVARNSAVYTGDGRYNLLAASHRRAFAPIEEGCDCYTCAHYTKAYLHHLFKAKEMLASTLATIHNERFTVRLVDDIRASIGAGDFDAFRAEFLGRFYR